MAWGLERNNEVAFSKSIRNNEAVNFADEFRIEVGSQLKRVVALQAMDDKLVVFKEDSIYVIYGDGPTTWARVHLTERSWSRAIKAVLVPGRCPYADRRDVSQ